MKHGVIVAVAAISMAGAASASLLTTSSQDTASSQRTVPKVPAGEAPQLASRARPAEPRTEIAANPAPAPVERKAALEVRQAPVPMQVKPRPALYLPTANITEASSKAEAGPSAKAEALTPAPGNGLGENAARAAIQADGYKAVQALSKGVNGVWRAKAMRGTTEVSVAVDSRGSVTTAD